MSVDFRIFPDVMKDMVDKVVADPDVTSALGPYLEGVGGIFPAFEYGTYLELLQTCIRKDNNQEAKYPLIWLVWDAAENQQKWIEPYMYTLTAKVFICDRTNIDSTTSQRYAETLKPILYPIFFALIEALGNHPCVELNDEFIYPANDHPFWLNNPDGSYDTLSAIEISLQNMLIYKN